MNNVIPLQNSPERVSLLPIAPGVDFATALSLRRMATSTGATPAYLLAPEVSALLFYMPDQRHHMLFATLWNTGMRIGEARMLTPESFDLNGVRPFVRILSEKVRARRGRPPKDEVRLVPLTDIITASPGKSSRHWLVTGIHVRWRFIPECLHWIWLPRWQCLSQVTGGMLRRSCVHCLP